MATTLPYNFAHCWEEMYKGIDEQGPYYSVKYVFDDYTQSDAVCNALRGIATRSGGTTTRTTPHQHPLSPNLYCRSARVEGASGPVLNPQGYPGYSGSYFVRAEYRASLLDGVLQFSDDPFNLQQIDPATPQLWCTQEIDWDVDTVVVPNNQFVWTTDGKKTGIPVKVDLGVTLMRLTFHRVPYMPMGVMRLYRNRVNSATFLGGDPGCVLFKGGSTHRDYNTDGTVVQSVTLNFAEREKPWYQSLRRDRMTWDTPQDASGNFTYKTADLAPLLAAFS